MAEIVPTVGRIVLYQLSAVDVTSIRTQRELYPEGDGSWYNEVAPGQVFPAMVVKTWGNRPDSAINLKVMLDGADTFWATSRVVGDTDGTYHWMSYQKKVASGEIEPNFHAVKDAAR